MATSKKSPGRRLWVLCALCKPVFHLQHHQPGDSGSETSRHLSEVT
jgi:hypothetical protein